ncbi:hypothetical protein D915_002335 [Fasciola hepatica]|uniref:Uncharacterized protein n=1 Tax=Fasciola hepatica TaxID=6192 RepID=A0A4E0RW09_FASHE|nr:hypothetical protein D915_002335 [Fasciola hepatica]
MFRNHTAKLSAPRHSTHDLSTSVKYQIDATTASVQRTPLEPWISACSPLLLCSHPSSRCCRDRRGDPNPTTGAACQIPASTVSKASVGYHCDKRIAR